MTFPITSSITLQKLKAETILNDADFEGSSADNIRLIPFSITLNSQMEVLDSKRLEREVLTEADLKSAGMNYKFKGDTVTLDVLIRPLDKSLYSDRMAVVFIIPDSILEDYTGNVLEKFRLRKEYLPRLETCKISSTAQTFDAGIATVDIPTQTVTHFEQRNGDPLYNENSAGKIIQEVDKNTIKVSAFFANGGFNFNKIAI